MDPRFRGDDESWKVAPVSNESPWSREVGSSAPILRSPFGQAGMREQRIDQSTFAPEALTTFAHFSLSARMKLPNCSGDPPAASAPWLRSFSRASELCSHLLTSTLILATIGAGVPAGASTPNQELASKPGSPLSLMVGMSGSTGARFNEVTAIARNLPPLICGSADGRLSNMICTWPPTRSVSAGELPLYGTCVMSTPAMVLNNSPER